MKIRDDTVALFQKYTKFVFPNTSDAFFGSDGSAIYVARSNSDVLYLHNELYNEADSITFDNDDLIIDFSLTGDEENPVSDGHKYMDLAKAVFIRMMYYINSTKFDNKILPGAGGLKTMIYCTKDGEKNIDVARITYAYGCILYYEKGQPDENTQGIQLFGIEDFF